MKSQGLQIKDQVFAFYSFWQIIGALSLVESIFLPVYGAGMFVFAFFVALDVKSFPKRLLDYPLKLKIKSSMHLLESERVEMELEANCHAVSLVDLESKILNFGRESEFPFILQSDGIWKISLLVKGKSIGFEVWEELNLRFESKLGLWSKTMAFSIEKKEIRVHPELKKVPSEKMNEFTSLQYLQGERSLNRGTSPDQFHSVRKFAYPDPMRFIDAKKSSRYQKLMVRNYEQWKSNHLVIGLDVGRNMLGNVRGMPKIDFYISAALSLASEAIANGDRVSFFSMSDRATNVLKDVKNQCAFGFLYRGQIDAQDLQPKMELLPPTLSQISNQRTIFLMLTDWLKPSTQNSLMKVLPAISQRHLTAVIGLDDEEFFVKEYIEKMPLGQLSKTDFGKLAYRYRLNDKKEDFTQKISRLGVVTVHAPDQYWLNVVGLTYRRLRSSLASG